MEQVDILRKNIGDTNLSTLQLNLLLDLAKNCFLDIKYPFDSTVTTIPERYLYWQILCAKELYNKLGFEGIGSYSENGLSIGLDQAMSVISPSLRNMIIPKAGVPS